MKNGVLHAHVQSVKAFQASSSDTPTSAAPGSTSFRRPSGDSHGTCTPSPVQVIRTDEEKVVPERLTDRSPLAPKKGEITYKKKSPWTSPRSIERLGLMLKESDTWSRRRTPKRPTAPGALPPRLRSANLLSHSAPPWPLSARSASQSTSVPPPTNRGPPLQRVTIAIVVWDIVSMPLQTGECCFTSEAKHTNSKQVDCASNTIFRACQFQASRFFSKHAGSQSLFWT